MEVTGPNNQFTQPLRVLFVKSLKEFYFATEAGYQELNRLMTEMLKVYSSPRASQYIYPMNMQIGELYAVYCYDEWYRAKLMRLDQPSDPRAKPDMTFSLIDYGETLALQGGKLYLVAQLVPQFRSMPPVALLGRLASVYPRPGMEKSATSRFISEVSNRQMHGFCMRAPSSENVNAAANQEPYHLQLFFVPNGLYQTEYHANGLDGKMLSACLVHTPEDHYSAMHIGGARCDYCHGDADEDGEN